MNMVMEANVSFFAKSDLWDFSVLHLWTKPNFPPFSEFPLCSRLCSQSEILSQWVVVWGESFGHVTNLVEERISNNKGTRSFQRVKFYKRHKMTITATKVQVPNKHLIWSWGQTTSRRNLLQKNTTTFLCKIFCFFLAPLLKRESHSSFATLKSRWIENWTENEIFELLQSVEMFLSPLWCVDIITHQKELNFRWQFLFMLRVVIIGGRRGGSNRYREETAEAAEVQQNDEKFIQIKFSGFIHCAITLKISTTCLLISNNLDEWFNQLLIQPLHRIE